MKPPQLALTGCLAALLFPAILPGAEITNLSFFAKGNLTYQVNPLTKDGTPQEGRPFTREFEVVANASTWKIRTRLTGDTTFDYFQYSYDGTNLYYTWKTLPGTEAKAWAPGQESKSNDELLQTVIVEEAPVPKSQTSDGLEAIWLTFLSGRYFKSLSKDDSVMDFQRSATYSGGVPTPFRQKVKCRYSIAAFAPFLPNSVVYHAPDYNLVGTRSTNETSIAERFESGGFTNFNHCFLPTHFTFVRYAPKAGTNGLLSTNISLTVKGAITAFSTAQPDWGKHIPEKRVMVADQRVMEVPDPGLIYPLTGGQLPPKDDAYLETLRNDIRARARLGTR